MTANEYKLMQKCVEDGVNYGYCRAFKHTETPSESAIKDAIVDAVMLEICEWFDFEEKGKNEI